MRLHLYVLPAGPQASADLAHPLLAGVVCHGRAGEHPVVGLQHLLESLPPAAPARILAMPRWVTRAMEWILRERMLPVSVCAVGGCRGSETFTRQMLGLAAHELTVDDSKARRYACPIFASTRNACMQLCHVPLLVAAWLFPLMYVRGLK